MTTLLISHKTTCIFNSFPKTLRTRTQLVRQLTQDFYLSSTNTWMSVGRVMEKQLSILGNRRIASYATIATMWKTDKKIRKALAILNALVQARC